MTSRSIYILIRNINYTQPMTMQLCSSFVGTAQFSRAARPTMPSSASSGATRSVTCMAKKKGVRMIVTLECTEARAEGGTPSRYVRHVVVVES